LKLLGNNNIDIVFVPAYCTGELQLMDLSISKDFMHLRLEEWYVKGVFDKCQGASLDI